MKPFDDFLASFAADETAIAQQVLDQCSAVKTLPTESRIAFLESVKASVLLWKELTGKYHAWLEDQVRPQ